MTNLKILESFTSEDLVLLFMGYYHKQYGDLKGLEILKKVESSQRINQFITKLLKENLDPGEQGFITIVNSIPYFFFSKGETLCYGALWATQKWIKLDFLSEKRAKEIVISTILKASQTKVNLSGNASFFEKFYEVLNNTLELEIIKKNNYEDLVAF